MRKRLGRIETQRHQKRQHRFGEIGFDLRAFFRLQSGAVDEVDALFRQRRRQHLEKVHLRVVAKIGDFRLHALLMRRLRSAVKLASCRDQLCVPRHRKLVDAAADDAEELHPLQQRVRFVTGFVEHAPVKLNQAEVAIQWNGSGCRC